MNVDFILKHKGASVVSVDRNATAAEASGILSQRRIGALLVVGEAGAPVGILSERDIVSGIAQRGEGCLALPVEALMTRELVTCGPEDTVDRLMQLMTERRVRHLPVMADGKLVGIVSIGDVVKHRLTEIEHEAEALRQYIATG